MLSTSPLKPYANRRMAALVGVGFASGLPNVLANDTAQAWLSALDIDVKKIGLFSLVGLPYAFKFLWAPLMDRFTPPGLHRLGRRRGWLVVTQSLVTLLIAAMALVGPRHATDAVTPLLVLGTIMVFMSASLDIVADAYRTDIAGGNELGPAAAVFVSGYRLAYIIGGGAALILAKRIGWPTSFALMTVLMAATTVMTFLAPEPKDSAAKPATLGAAVIRPITNFVQRHGWHVIVIVAFVVLFRLPDLLAKGMTMPLLLKKLQFSSEQVGWVRQVLGFGLTVIGALVGGGFVPRLGLIRSLVLFGILQAVSNAGFWWLALHPPELWSMTVVIAIENFCGGLVAAGFVAYLMSCCEHRYSATQYALLAGLMAASQSLGGALTGYVVDRVGYGTFFAITIASGIPGMLMIPFLQGERTQKTDAA